MFEISAPGDDGQEVEAEAATEEDDEVVESDSDETATEPGGDETAEATEPGSDSDGERDPAEDGE